MPFVNETADQIARIKEASNEKQYWLFITDDEKTLEDFLVFARIAVAKEMFSADVVDFGFFKSMRLGIVTTVGWMTIPIGLVSRNDVKFFAKVAFNIDDVPEGENRIIIIKSDALDASASLIQIFCSICQGTGKLSPPDPSYN